MRVYKFLSSKYGLKALQDRRLKISEVHSLNDPYDLLPFDLSDPEIRRGVLASKEQIGEKCGMLCFSRYWHNPVLWAHYAENHKGFCLGFDVLDDSVQAIEYVEHPIRLTHLDLDVPRSMLFTKYVHWRYEDEIRTWARLEKKSGPYYFCDFSENLRLAEIIVGAGSPISKRRILRALGARMEGVALLKARLAFNAFGVVEDENGLPDGQTLAAGAAD